MSKTAYFTVDVETLFEASCVGNRRYDKTCDAKKGFVELLKTFESFGISATLFLTGETLEKWKDEIKFAALKGHELAVHAFEHKSVVGMSDEEFENSVKAMKRSIEENFQVLPIGYRAPCFGIDEGKIRTLEKLGFRYDSSALNFKKAMCSGSLDLTVFEKLDDSTYRRGGFYEIKPTIAKTLVGELPMSGGGYLRLMPWSFVKSELKKYFKKSDSYVFYVHPFEVIGEKIPKFDDIKPIERLYLKRGRKNYLKKIVEIIKTLKKYGYEFKTMGQSVKEYDIEK